MKPYPRDGRSMRQAAPSHKRAVSNMLRAYRWGVGYVVASPRTFPDWAGPALRDMMSNIGFLVSESDRRRIVKLAKSVGRAQGPLGVQ